MQRHTVVLMRDGEKELHEHPVDAGATLAAVRDALDRVGRGRGCFKLSVEGPVVNLHGTVDVPAPTATGTRARDFRPDRRR